jgi:hypothetical protein
MPPLSDWERVGVETRLSLLILFLFKQLKKTGLQSLKTLKVLPIIIDLSKENSNSFSV